MRGKPKKGNMDSTTIEASINIKIMRTMVKLLMSKFWGNKPPKEISSLTHLNKDKTVMKMRPVVACCPYHFMTKK